MALKDGKKLSKEEAAQVRGRSRGNLAEYESVFGELDEGEGYRYEIGENERSITERSRWMAVAERQGFIVTFSTKKDRSTGKSTVEIVKGSQTGVSEVAAAPAPTGRGRRSS